MKITSFEPLIVTPTAKFESTKELFELMGFEQQHKADQAEGSSATHFVFKNPDGFKVDIVSSDYSERDEVSIRMNVRDLDEAVEFLESKGFTNRTGQEYKKKAAKSVQMVAPSGFTLSIIEHIK